MDRYYRHVPIAYHDTWLSVDPIVGCRLSCEYCFLRLAQWTGIRPQIVHSIPKILGMLLTHKYFTPHRTILSFCNCTDPFLADNVPHTLEFVNALDAQKLTNPVVLTTKVSIPDRFINEVSRLRYTRLVFCLSYSGLSELLEVGVDPQDNLNNFRKLSQRGLRVIHLFRPLLEVNGTQAVMGQVLDRASPYACATVYNGLNLNPALRPVYNKAPALRVPGSERSEYGEYLPRGVERRLKGLVARCYPRYPLYKHTSCAVSLALSAPDYNATVYTKSICLTSRCPDWKRRLCQKAKTPPSRSEVGSLLERLALDCDFTINRSGVRILGELSQEDFVFLLHRLNYPLTAQGIKYTRVFRGSIFRTAPPQETGAPDERNTDVR